MVILYEYGVAWKWQTYIWPNSCRPPSWTKDFMLSESCWIVPGTINPED